MLPAPPFDGVKPDASYNEEGELLFDPRALEARAKKLIAEGRMPNPEQVARVIGRLREQWPGAVHRPVDPVRARRRAQLEEDERRIGQLARGPKGPSRQRPWHK